MRRILVANKSFQVKSYYQVLAGEANTAFHWTAIWLTRAPTKVSFFDWCAVKDRILTIDNLMRHEMVIVNQCCMWFRDVESVAHLLIHCPIAKELWDEALVSWGMSWVFPSTVVELIQEWYWARVGRRI